MTCILDFFFIFFLLEWRGFGKGLGGEERGRGGEGLLNFNFILKQPGWSRVNGNTSYINE